MRVQDLQHSLLQAELEQLCDCWQLGDELRLVRLRNLLCVVLDRPFEQTKPLPLTLVLVQPLILFVYHWSDLAFFPCAIRIDAKLLVFWKKQCSIIYPNRMDTHRKIKKMWDAKFSRFQIESMWINHIYIFFQCVSYYLGVLWMAPISDLKRRP